MELSDRVREVEQYLRDLGPDDRLEVLRVVGARAVRRSARFIPCEVCGMPREIPLSRSPDGRGDWVPARL